MPANQQIKAFYKLKSILQLSDHEKKLLVLKHTDGRTSSTRELNNVEINLLIRKMQSMAGLNPEENDRLRKKIISQLRSIGFTSMIDVQSIIEKHWKKPFNAYTREELLQIINVIEKQWIPFYLKKNNG